MRVTRKFDDKGMSFDEVMKGILLQAVEELIDDALFNEKYEGISGGTEDGNETSEL